MYLGFHQETTTNTVKTADDLTIPARATRADVVAEVQDARYTMDDSTNPSQSKAMLMKTTDPPKQFLIEDIRRIRFVRGAGANGRLNFHFFGGRDI